jgi:hypothetical protein
MYLYLVYTRYILGVCVYIYIYLECSWYIPGRLQIYIMFNLRCQIMWPKYAAKFAAQAVQTVQPQIGRLSNWFFWCLRCVALAVGKKPASERSSERETASTRMGRATPHTHTNTHARWKVVSATRLPIRDWTQHSCMHCWCSSGGVAL